MNQSDHFDFSTFPTLTTDLPLSLAGLTVAMQVTQHVNGTNGVHALLPHGAYQRIADFGNRQA